ncbi:MAG: hypothetical protein ABWX90_02500 [Candidatus Saccharimonadales bacterium]
MSVADLVFPFNDSRLSNGITESVITPEIQKVLDENGYYMPKLINGQLCALMNYMFTTGIVVNISEYSYERRYCYHHPVEALLAMEVYEDVTQHAPGDWIKCKGAYMGQPIDCLNPKFCEN